jgi:hypothetical protein
METWGAAMNYETVRQAILNRRSLACVYDTHVRFFSPHILGKSPDGGVTVVGFQYAGGRQQGRLPSEGEWCCFRVDRLQRLRPVADKWTTGPLSSYPEGRVSAIDVSAWS